MQVTMVTICNRNKIDDKKKSNGVINYFQNNHLINFIFIYKLSIYNSF